MLHTLPSPTTPLHTSFKTVITRRSDRIDRARASRVKGPEFGPRPSQTNDIIKLIHSLVLAITWFVQYTDKVTDWDIGSRCMHPGLPVGNHYKVAMGVHCHESVPVLISLSLGVMKMGNIVPREEIEPTSMAFWASVLPLHHIDSLMSPLCPFLPVYAAPHFRGQCRPLHSSP